MKEAATLRARSLASSRTSSRGSRRTSGSSGKSGISVEDNIDENSRRRTEEEKHVHNIIGNKPLVCRTYSVSPTLFRRRCIKNQNKYKNYGKVENISKPLRIEIPHQNLEYSSNTQRNDVLSTSQDPNPSYDKLVTRLCDTNDTIVTNSTGNNSPSGGSNNSSKSVHFAPELKLTGATNIGVVQTSRISNKHTCIDVPPPMETNLDESMKPTSNINKAGSTNSLELKHKDSFPINQKQYKQVNTLPSSSNVFSTCKISDNSSDKEVKNNVSNKTFSIPFTTNTKETRRVTCRYANPTVSNDSDEKCGLLMRKKENVKRRNKEVIQYHNNYKDITNTIMTKNIDMKKVATNNMGKSLEKHMLFSFCLSTLLLS